MSNQLFLCRDAETREVEYIDLASAKVFSDAEGLHFKRQMYETEVILGDKGESLRGPDGRVIHVQKLRNVATEHYYSEVARASRRGIKCNLREDDGRLVTLDLGVNDVHTNATIPTYAAGYSIGESMADVASPVLMSPKASDIYYTWNVDSDFKRKVPTAASGGGAVAEVNPAATPSTFTTVEYALGGFLPTEVQSNADTPLQPFSKMVQMVVDALRLEREIRVAAGLQTSGNWNANLVQTLLAGSQWNGGANSDPLANLHHAIEQSYMPVTGIVWSQLVRNDFVRNPKIQAYLYAKNGVAANPDNATLSREFDLPPIYTASMKYSTGGAATYVWGNHVTLLRQPKENPPTSQMDVASAYSFRWNGGIAPDGTLTAGMLIRTFWDPKRGARGGTQVIVAHNDAEQQTSGYVGGLILNAHQ